MMLRSALKGFSVTAVLSLAACAHIQPKPTTKKCDRSHEELIQIAKADQAERDSLMAQVNLNLEAIAERDEIRLKRVEEISAAQCLKSADDYGSAALVYLHGTTVDQIHQSFLWFKESVRLGNTVQRALEATAIDLYLVKMGQKQLFGTQLNKKPGFLNEWCVVPYEKSFPDRIRAEYVGQGIHNLTLMTLIALNPSQDHPKIEECISVNLKPTPKGAFPEIW